MEKFEIKPENLKSFIKKIRLNENFRAMAVTMPYKKEILKYLDNFDSFAKKAQAINLVIKKKKKLIGFNTDVYGAEKSIKKFLKKYKLIIIIGIGGTGLAIFNFLIKKFKKKDFILISKKLKKNNLKNVKIQKKINSKILENKALIINCSPLGSDLKKKLLNKTPIPYYLIKKINRGSTVFDIIYSPKKTHLYNLCLKNNIKYINGKMMNTMQAKRALQIAFQKK